MKAAFLDPNPVVMLEHKGLYWSKIKGTEGAKTVEPDADYILPLGKGRMALEATADKRCLVVTYGMGVYWSLAAAEALPGQVGVLDLRTLAPLDEALILEQVAAYNRVLVLTEEPANHSFAQALAGRISEKAFQHLDAPVQTLGAVETPAIPLNTTLEAELLPNAGKVEAQLRKLLAF
jgi:2-oxoisovalerate dehydrogenase E1 component